MIVHYGNRVNKNRNTDISKTNGGVITTIITDTLNNVCEKKIF